MAPPSGSTRLLFSRRLRRSFAEFSRRLSRLPLFGWFRLSRGWFRRTTGRSWRTIGSRSAGRLALPSPRRLSGAARNRVRRPGPIAGRERDFEFVEFVPLGVGALAVRDGQELLQATTRGYRLRGIHRGIIPLFGLFLPFDLRVEGPREKTCGAIRFFNATDDA